MVNPIVIHVSLTVFVYKPQLLGVVRCGLHNCLNGHVVDGTTCGGIRFVCLAS